MKLVVLGGGGVRSPFLAKSLALAAKEINLTEVVFMDIDEEKLFIYGKIAKEIARRIEPELKFSLTIDAKTALKDADYIITTIRAEGDSGRVIDEKTALQLGVLGQETTGAGGFAMALRSIPVLKEYCEIIKEVSKPDSVVFNFTNPSGLVTQALHTMGFKNVYGVCDAPSNFFRQLSQLIGANDFNAECFGLNHLSWFYNFKSNGKDVTKEILLNQNLYKDTEMRLFNKELISICDCYLPNEYLYFYFYRDKAVESVLSSGKTRGETILEINEDMMNKLREIDIDNDFEKAFHCFMEHYAMRENSYFSIESGQFRTDKFNVPSVEEYLAQPENGSYAAVAIDFIRAKQGSKKVNMVLSVENNGSLDFLRDEDVCELSCTVDKDGVYPHKASNVPLMHKNLIRIVKQYENLTVQAIIEKDRQKAIKALTIHPLICSYPLAEKLVDSYCSAYKSYIGEWK